MELWEIKDSMARQHAYQVESLVADLRARPGPADADLVDLRTTKGRAKEGGRPDEAKEKP